MSNRTTESGILYVVATPIGNLQDITLRAVQTLRDADTIAVEDTRHSRRLLDHLGIDKPLIALHDHNEDTLSDALVGRLEGGTDIALISDAGTPLISDPGFPLVRACRAKGIDVVPIPGASAVITALSAAGLPTDRFHFEGFPARKPGLRADHFRRLSHATATLVFYESSHRLLASLADMATAFGGQRLAVVARELTKLHETFLSGSLTELVARVASDDNQRRGEVVVLVAGADEMRPESELGLDHALQVLLAQLPLKQSAAIAAKLCAVHRNRAYERALELKADP